MQAHSVGKMKSFASFRAPADHDGFIHVRGANENNLDNVEVRIPRDSIVAFTGVSGSGKSSLAFGTIFAESQRRFLESVAPYARRLIAQGHTPKVEFISGLPPAVALQQRRGAASSRSTVGTLTTLSNSVRMLFSRAGTYPQGAARLDSDAFSTNTAAGACAQCHGAGTVHSVSEESLVPDSSLSIRDGAIAAWPGAWQGKNLRDITTHLGYDIDVPFQQLPAETRKWLLFTEDQPVVEVTPERDRVAKPYKGRFWSAERYVRHTVATSKSENLRSKALAFMHSQDCPACSGTGLRPDALQVTFDGLDIAEFNGKPLSSLAELLRPFAADAQAEAQAEVASIISADLLGRIQVLVELGLGYLSLDRATPTLSPGDRRDLSAGEGEPGSVCDVDEQHARRAQQLGDLAVELDAGQMGRSLGPREDVGHDQIARARDRRGHAADAVSGVADAQPDGGAAGEWKVFPHQRDERSLELDHLLAGPGAGRLDVAGDRECAGAEVHGGEGSGGELIDHGAHAGDVLEVKMTRIVEVDMRLGSAVDHELIAAREFGRGDPGLAAVVEPGVRMLGVASACPSHSSRLRGSRALVERPEWAFRCPMLRASDVSGNNLQGIS